MKQRTYLITLHLFDHLAQSLPTPEKFEKRRNVTSPARHRFAQGDLVRLLRFLRTISTRNHRFHALACSVSDSAITRQWMPRSTSQNRASFRRSQAGLDSVVITSSPASRLRTCSILCTARTDEAQNTRSRSPLYAKMDASHPSHGCTCFRLTRGT